MKTRSFLIVAVAALVLGGVARGQFVPGHVFVVAATDPFCAHPWLWPSDRIWEIDPETGEVTLFVELPECYTLWGATFTPDGARLRVSALMTSSILEFDSQGNFTVVLDSSDGIAGPWGPNSTAYDAAGNFYVANYWATNILRFPTDGGPPTVFADSSDGLGGLNGIAFTADGDLYVANFLGAFNNLLRISPDGEVTIFDTVELNVDPKTLTGDDEGHLYVGLSNGDLLRYQAGDADSREILVPDLFGSLAIAMSLDERELYVFNAYFETRVLTVDADSGDVSLLVEFEDSWSTAGMAVVPLPALAGDLDGDGDVDLGDFGVFLGCFSGPGGGPLPPECEGADLDGDEDADLADFALLQSAFTGL